MENLMIKLMLTMVLGLSLVGMECSVLKNPGPVVDRDLRPTKKLDNSELADIEKSLNEGIKQGKLQLINGNGNGNGGNGNGNGRGKKHAEHFHLERVNGVNGAEHYHIKRTSGQRGRKSVAEVYGYSGVLRSINEMKDSKTKQSMLAHYNAIVGRKLIESAKCGKQIHLTKEDLNSSVIKPLIQYYKKSENKDISF